MADDTDTIDTTVDTTTDTSADTKAADTKTVNIVTDDTKVADTSTDTKTGDDWRATMAGDDPDLLKYLGRFTSQQAAMADAKKTHGEIRSGKYIKPLGDDPSTAELAAWRKTMGVPETPDGYTAKLPEGLVVGEADKPYFDKFFTKMHEVNAPPALANAAVEAYRGIVEEQATEAAEMLATAKAESEDALRGEWGGDYRRNLNVMHAHLDTLPAAVKEAFTNGFGADGKPLGYNADVLKWLTSLALDANPHATLVPGAGSNQASAIADEIAANQKLMADPRSEYWVGPNAAKLQARQLELIAASEKLKGQG